ncbi:putative DNA modification/repair radical SAM protein [Ottowia sp. GY511]|uniref:DNA modification/repair radical SAM protein n=1 Tax=Ottowia flava TaxID=2675430 RepID=A0ABW4KT12_9BURK|nr:putative DNA modification/repair radical SAM protein [Ottowia sp. GY511]TXK33449.1 putative DNA modification/repair radical SAM protein [Ottowia sp. GY511]
MDTLRKLEILADAAKYDASCASSGGQRRDSRDGTGMGSVTGSGICHSYAPDGRCISLLKVLLTNYCVYDCRYCINRVSSNVARARFTVQEVVALTLDFYRRNCIEGLFLSSGIIQSPDYTMEQLVRVARSLREEHDFRGYIHLKTIPDASAELLALAGRYADRLSINVELPTAQGLSQLAPEKDGKRIRAAMGEVAGRVSARKAAVAQQSHIQSLPRAPARRARVPRFAPAGQSTQMIVGADRASDRDILLTSSSLYTGYGLRRVYYSAFSPIPDASSDLPLQAPPLMREHRLYQADWLMRFYGYAAQEIVPATATGADMLDLDIDPKLAWALANRQAFPVDLNRAPKSMLLRVPGLGPRTVGRLLMARRARRIRHEDLLALRIPVHKALAFIVVDGHVPRDGVDSLRLRAALLQQGAASVAQRTHSGLRRVEPAQASLF